jgi:hypothetical protein
MNKTKLDLERPEHQLLVGTLSMLVDDFEYSPRELFTLLDDCKRRLWRGLQQMVDENREVRGE